MAVSFHGLKQPVLSVSLRAGWPAGGAVPLGEEQPAVDVLQRPEQFCPRLSFDALRVLYFLRLTEGTAAEEKQPALAVSLSDPCRQAGGG